MLLFCKLCISTLIRKIEMIFLQIVMAKQMRHFSIQHNSWNRPKSQKCPREGPHSSMQSERLYFWRVECMERKHVEDVRNLGIMIQSVVLFSISIDRIHASKIMLHQEIEDEATITKLDLPLYNHDHRKYMFVDALREYLSPPICVHIECRIVNNS